MGRISSQGSVRVLADPLTKLPQHQHLVTTDPPLASTSYEAEPEGVDVAVQTGWDMLPPLSLSLPLHPRASFLWGRGDLVTSLLFCFQLSFPPHAGKSFFGLLVFMPCLLPPQVSSQVKTLPLKMITGIICLRSSPGSPT